ncbi:MAG: CSLREA domain-containing protein [Candidatus Dojkabacteria bacterium]|nr:CSLREA domain-containing protein [Candidatus Dojkabacteria bacterium]
MIAENFTVEAATITVTTTADEFGPGNDCSLREAVQAVNSGSPYGGCPAGDGSNDTITLPAGTFTLTLVGKDEDLNATGDIDISADVTIIGAGASQTIISGNAGGTADADKDRVFHIADNVSVEFSDVTIQDGYYEKRNDPFNYTGWIHGGGILSGDGSSLRIIDSVVQNNTILREDSQAYGGGISISDEDTTLHIENSSIINNELILEDTDKDGSMGGRAAGISVEDIYEGIGDDNSAGVDITIIDSEISDNTATCDIEPPALSSWAFIEGVGLEVDYVRSFSMADSHINNNTAYLRDGYVSAWGPGLLIWRLVQGGTIPQIYDSTINGNTSTTISETDVLGYGAGILSYIPMEITRTQINGNGQNVTSGWEYVENWGGGIFIDGGSVSQTSIIRQCTISNNYIDVSIDTDSSAMIFGAGIYLDGGTVEISTTR